MSNLKNKTWYIVKKFDERHKVDALVYYVEDSPALYGWGHTGDWVTRYANNQKNWIAGVKEISGDDVYARMKEMVSRIGYKVGDTVEHISVTQVPTTCQITMDNISFNIDEEILWMGNVVLYWKGTWRKISVKGMAEDDQLDQELVDKAALAILQACSSNENPEFIDFESLWFEARRFVKAREE